MLALLQTNRWRNRGFRLWGNHTLRKNLSEQRNYHDKYVNFWRLIWERLKIDVNLLRLTWNVLFKNWSRIQICKNLKIIKSLRMAMRVHVPIVITIAPVLCTTYLSEHCCGRSKLLMRASEAYLGIPWMLDVKIVLITYPQKIWATYYNNNCVGVSIS